MESAAEVYAATFSQLSFISAVLGGFAFAAASALLAAGPSLGGRAVGLTVGLAAASAACTILCALAWTLATVQATALERTGHPMPASLFVLHARMSLIFIAGVLLLFTSLGTSGWVRSRTLGIVTTGIAFVSGIASLLIIGQFVV